MSNTNEVADEMIRSIENLNRPPKQAKVRVTNGGIPTVSYDFVRLGSEIARATVEAAQAQVKQAEALAEQTKDSATKIAAAITKSIMDAAELRVIQAKGILEEAHNFAADLRQQVENKDREMVELGDRLESFGGTMREAYVKFCTEVMVSQDAEADPAKMSGSEH